MINDAVTIKRSLLPSKQSLLEGWRSINENMYLKLVVAMRFFFVMRVEKCMCFTISFVLHYRMRMIFVIFSFHSWVY